MEKTTFGHFQAVYNEPSDTLRILINNAYLLNITSENIEQVLEDLEAIDYSTTTHTITVMAQPIAAQEFVYGDGYVDSEGILVGANYSLYDNDISAFHSGEPTELELSFNSMGDGLLLHNEILMAPSSEWMLA